MKKNKFRESTVHSPVLFQFNRNSHVLFVWTDFAYRKIYYPYRKVTHLVFNNSHYILYVDNVDLYVGNLDSRESIVKNILKHILNKILNNILNYVSKHKEISDELFKDRLHKVCKKYSEDRCRFYYVKFGEEFS